MNKTTNRFAPEVRARAVRMVLDHEGDHPSHWAATVSIAEKIGCVPQTVFEWVKNAEVDSGRRAGVPNEMADRLETLERENRERRLADEILRKASAYFDRVDGLTLASHSCSPRGFLSDKEDRHEELRSDW